MKIRLELDYGSARGLRGAVVVSRAAGLRGLDTGALGHGQSCTDTIEAGGSGFSGTGGEKTVIWTVILNSVTPVCSTCQERVKLRSF